MEYIMKDVYNNYPTMLDKDTICDGKLEEYLKESKFDVPTLLDRGVGDPIEETVLSFQGLDMVRLVDPGFSYNEVIGLNCQVAVTVGSDDILGLDMYTILECAGPIYNESINTTQCVTSFLHFRNVEEDLKAEGLIIHDDDNNIDICNFYITLPSCGPIPVDDPTFKPVDDPTLKPVDDPTCGGEIYADGGLWETIELLQPTLMTWEDLYAETVTIDIHYPFYLKSWNFGTGTQRGYSEYSDFVISPDRNYVYTKTPFYPQDFYDKEFRVFISHDPNANISGPTVTKFRYMETKNNTRAVMTAYWNLYIVIPNCNRNNLLLEETTEEPTSTTEEPTSTTEDPNNSIARFISVSLVTALALIM